MQGQDRPTTALVLGESWPHVQVWQQLRPWHVQLWLENRWSMLVWSAVSAYQCTWVLSFHLISSRFFLSSLLILISSLSFPVTSLSSHLISSPFFLLPSLFLVVSLALSWCSCCLTCTFLLSDPHVSVVRLVWLVVGSPILCHDLRPKKSSQKSPGHVSPSWRHSHPWRTLHKHPDGDGCFLFGRTVYWWFHHVSPQLRITCGKRYKIISWVFGKWGFTNRQPKDDR